MSFIPTTIFSCIYCVKISRRISMLIYNARLSQCDIQLSVVSLVAFFMGTKLFVRKKLKENKYQSLQLQKTLKFNIRCFSGDGSHSFWKPNDPGMHCSSSCSSSWVNKEARSPSVRLEFSLSHAPGLQSEIKKRLLSVTFTAIDKITSDFVPFSSGQWPLEGGWPHN